MDQIKNIVYLMLENRSLDNVLGWLYKDSNPAHVFPAGSSPVFNGLNTGPYYNPDSNGQLHQVTTVPAGNQQVPSVDPNEVYEHVNFQLFGSQDNPSWGTPAAMNGFLIDFNDSLEILQCYDPAAGLPVINALARSFAVSDAYFSSVPTQTNCNRAFAATGNSIGWLRAEIFDYLTAMVDNHWGSGLDPAAPVEFNGPTIWDVLSQNGYGSQSDWMIYYSQYWTDVPGYCFTQDLLWPTLQNYNNFSDISNFYAQAAAGTLPTFSFLEPAWFEKEMHVGWNGNDYHPPANLGPGESFVRGLYKALVSSPQWKNTLFIINFDEHGGTYDHVPPPWNATPPWQNPSDGTSAPSVYEKGFGFDRFGVRVPLILISPYVPLSTVFRSGTDTPFDHTSVIATILNFFGIPKSQWQLGSRVANAPTFENVVSLSTPREDIPELPAAAGGEREGAAAGERGTSDAAGEKGGEDVEPNDLQRMVAARMLSRALQKSQFPKDKFMTLYDEQIKSAGTVRQLMSATHDLLRTIAPK